MKKLFIVLLATMLVFSLTSCKDKSEEVIETYEKFCSTVTLGDRVMKTFDDPVDFDTNTTAADPNLINLSRIIGLSSGSVVDVKSIDSKAGKVEVVSNDDSSKTTITWKNVVIAYKYTEGSDNTEKDGKLTISGSYGWEELSKRGEPVPTTYRYSFTINSTSYSADYTQDEGYKYTDANVNGKGVNLRILNAGM